MWADLLSAVDEKHAHRAADLRKQFPRFAAALDDWHLAARFPNAFDWAAMPVGWKTAQRMLTAEYARFQTWLQVQQVQKMDFVGQVLKARGGF